MRILDDYETEILASAGNTAELDTSSLRLLGYTGTSYDLYEDDGYSMLFDLEKNIVKMKN